MCKCSINYEMSNLAVQKIIKPFYAVLKYGLLFLITSYGQTTAQTNEPVYILLNGNILENSKESEWIKNPSTIHVKNVQSETIIELAIKPEFGSIEIFPDSLFAINIYISDNIHESHIVKFKNNIVEYKIGLLADDESGNKYIYISARLGNNVNYTKYDLLIVPVAYKFSKKLFRKFFKSETTLQIHGIN